MDLIPKMTRETPNYPHDVQLERICSQTIHEACLIFLGFSLQAEAEAEKLLITKAILTNSSNAKDKSSTLKRPPPHGQKPLGGWGTLLP